MLNSSLAGIKAHTAPTAQAPIHTDKLIKFHIKNDRRRKEKKKSTEIY